MFRHCVLFSLWSLLLLLSVSPVQGQQQTGSFNLCLAAAADGTCVYPTQRFLSPTKQVIVAFPLTEGEPGQFTAQLVILDVGGAMPPNSVISRQDMQPAKGSTRGLLTFMGPPLPIGKYRVDVTAGGKPWKSVEFTVAAGEKAPDVKRPEDLLPLHKGQLWTYALVREASKGAKGLPPGPVPGIGAKIDLSTIAPGADGKYRAKVTLTAASTDQAGTRIEIRRDGVLAFEEWWRLDERGWAATQIKGPLGPSRIDPPQVLLPLPLTAPQEWAYEPKSGSFKQTYRMWGPVPVKGPRGEARGYVVLIEQLSSFAAITVERHFLPGVGLTREVSITDAGGEVSRTELVLH